MVPSKILNLMAFVPAEDEDAPPSVIRAKPPRTFHFDVKAVVDRNPSPIHL